MPQMILDSHIHLWPGSAANPQSHSWMQIGHHLARRYLVNDYNEATSHSARRSEVAGFVYVETDRTIAQDYVCDVSKWAAEPLEEIAFLRRIVEGTPKKDEDFDAEQADLLRGIVAWAPLDRPLHDFLRYMSTAKEIAGERTWNKIKGFRFLVQGIRDQGQFSRLLDPLGSSFVTLLKFLGTRNLSFDVGLDERQGGVWQLELFADTIEQAHNGVRPKDKTIFVLNHLCKPDMEQPPTASETKSVNFTRWKAAISRMAKEERVYMKLSGAFSEIVDQDPSSPMPVEDVIEHMQPWLDHIFTEFGPWRIMFGSDWPVCNVRGPGDTKSWSCWVDVVGQILQSRGLSEIEMNRVWYGTAIEAYRLDPIR